MTAATMGFALKRRLIAQFAAAGVLLAVVTSGKAESAPGVERREAPERLRVGYSDFAPYIVTTPNGEVRGFTPDLLRQFAAMRGYELSFARRDNPREVFDLMRVGAVDLTTALGASLERIQVTKFSRPVSSVSIVVITDDNSGFLALDDVGTHPVGVVAGSNAGRAARLVLPDAELVEFRSLDDLFLKLITDQVEAVVIPREPFLALSRRANMSERLRVLGDPLHEQAMMFGVHPARDGVLNDLNAALAALIESGALNETKDRWFGRDKRFFERADMQLYASAGIIGLLAMSLGGAVAWRSHRRATRNFAEVGANRLLIDALNGVDLLIVIYDSDLRVVHWNEAVEQHLPELVPLFEEGISFRDIVLTVIREGILTPHERARDPATLAAMLEEQLLAGRTEPRLVRSANGTVFEAVDFRVGTDMFASVRKNVTRLDEKAKHELKTSEARYEATFNRAPVGIAQISFDGAIVRANAELCTLLGQNDASVADVPLRILVHPSDYQRFDAYLDDVLADAQHDHSIEIRLMGTLDVELWANLTLSKVDTHSVEPGYLVAIVEDVTERKRSEDQRNLLMGELSHRVKNILAVVQSIVMQTLRRAGTSKIARDKVYSRLRAISAAHDIVFQAGSADIRPVLEAQFAPVNDGGAGRISLTGPRVTLSVDLVYALGLITHELTTNAMKHGALSNQTGTVEVEWTVTATEAHLTWTERGGPAVSPPTQSGFGSRLIEQMIGHTRDGSARFDYRPEGLVVDLNFNCESEP